MAISPVDGRAYDPATEAIADIVQSMNDTLDWQYSDVHRILLDIYGGDPTSPRSGPTMHSILMSMLQTMQTSKWGSAACPDDLNGNPWWATNSAFVLSSANYSFAFPDDGDSSVGTLSAPQFFSAWSGRLSAPQSRPTTAQLNRRFDWWGVSAYPTNGSISDRVLRSYTWFDWVADAFKTNLVLASTAGTNALLAAVDETGATSLVYGDTASTTNEAPVVTNQLQQLEVHPLDIDDASSIVDDVVGAIPVETIIPTDYTGGDPHVRIFGGATYGSIVVAPVDANFELPPNVRAALHAAARFLWRVLFLVAVWGIVRSEFDFWSTLGGSAT